MDELDKYVPAFKIGSGDINWDEMLIKVSEKETRLFACGAATLEEVVHAHKVMNKKIGI